MSKPPSDATMLRTVKAELARTEKERVALRTQRDEYRVRATKAEQEVAEWKARFDILLRREDVKPN